eukprot:Clim_evm39s119 gene=Clim_evmTU39s119
MIKDQQFLEDADAIIAEVQEWLESPTGPPDGINIFLQSHGHSHSAPSNQCFEFFIYSVREIAYLHIKHRILGALVGVHPRFSAQNDQHSLPLKLMREEAQLLRELEPTVKFVEIPTDSVWMDHHANYQHRQDEHRVSAQKALLNWKEQREARGLSLEKEAADLENPETARVHLKTVVDFLSAVRRTIPPTYDDQRQGYIEKDPEDIFKHDEDGIRLARYLVYRDLHARGYWLTSGLKFGGDFLVYHGDPNAFHSQFIAIVIDHDEPHFSMMDLVAAGRLGTSTRKTVLLAMAGKKIDAPIYHSVGWAGSGKS